MPTKRMDLKTVDMDTGEVKDGVLVWTPKKQRSLFSREGYVAMSQEAMERLSTANLGEVALRVLWKVLANLDMENWISLNQAEMADEMKLQKQNFNRALKKLIDEEIVLVGPKVGKRCTYRLNPHYGWKGRTESHVIAISDHLQNRMKKARIERVIDNPPMTEHQLAEQAGQQKLFDT